MKTSELTKLQTILMSDLYDISINEGGVTTLKNRFHTPAYLLEKRGFVKQIDRFPYRPVYIITPRGVEFWKARTAARVRADSQS